MRGSASGLILLAAAVLLTGCGNSEGAAPAGEAVETKAKVPTPTRKLGQWQHTVLAEGQTVSMKICLDKAMEERVSWWGQSHTPDDCSRNEVERQPDGTWTFSTICKTVAGGETTTSGAATGDFQSNYTVLASSTTSGATIERVNGTHDIKIDAKWLGPCPTGQRGGDIVLPNGVVMNIADMAQGATKP